MNASRIFLYLFLLLLQATVSLFGQNQKIVPGPDEIAFLQQTAQEMARTDQIYRNFLAKETLDTAIVAKIDSVFNTEGVEAGLRYESSLDLSLDQAVKDSLWQLQHAIDFSNHLILRGIFDTYGFLSEEVLGEVEYVQILLLMHPPKDWDIPTYLAEYSELLLAEVKAGRMQAKTFASFYDNIKGKILREPQLYGTNMQYDRKTKTVLPPMIEDLSKSNTAREAIGMEPLQEGEYRLLGKE